MVEVPQQWLRDDAQAVAIYSFEPGIAPGAADLTVGHMERLAIFAARLHRMGPEAPGAHFRPAVPATFSFGDQVDGIRRRFRLFDAFAATSAGFAVVPSPDCFQVVRQLIHDVPVAHELERLLARALSGLSDTAIHVRLPRAEWRFSTGDLAPHNLLIRADGNLTVLDLEYSGWDDPAIPIADFLSAQSSRKLQPVCTLALERCYQEATRLTADEVRRGHRVRALMEVGWLAVHLSLLVPERFAPKQFADPGFDLQAHLAQQVELFLERLGTADATLDRLLAG